MTQVLLATGALAVAVIVGFGALSRGTLEKARAPKPTPIPLVTFRAAPDGWAVGEHDAVLTLARGPVAGKATVARITVCRNAYAVAADGALAHGLDTDATDIAFSMARRDDLRKVIKPHAAKLAGLEGYYLDITIPAPRQSAATETDTWLARADLASCVVVVDTSDADSGVDPATQVTVPAIVRLGIFALPAGGNLMVLIASEGIGTRTKPDQTDVDEATEIVDGFTFHTAAP
ncbi:MAG: hypothetical protein M3P14_05655 [Chloroflexota bacterium]|nr:hypothetical protein [Chloroflexota bacterium]